MILNTFDNGYPKGTYSAERVALVAAQQKWLSIDLVNDPFAADALGAYIQAMEEDGDYTDQLRSLKSIMKNIFGPDSLG